VLVADPTRTMRAMLIEMLEGWGYAVDEAEDGLMALEKVRTAAENGQPYAVALVDMELPVLDSGSLAAAVREDEKLAMTRLMLLSNVGRRGDAARAEEWGYSAYLIKPVESSQFHAALLEVLRSDLVPGGSRRIVTRHSVAEQQRRRVRVLLVEDNPVNQLVAVAALRRVGYEPVVVATGAHALKAVADEPFDIVFMDLMLPGGMTGVDVAKDIRRREARVRHTPIVAVTAAPGDEGRRQCLEAGMDDFLPKPVDLERMCEMVELWTRKSAEGHAAPVREAATQLNAERGDWLSVVPDHEVSRITESTAQTRGTTSSEPVVEAVPEPVVESAPEAAATPEPVAEVALPPEPEVAAPMASAMQPEVTELEVTDLEPSSPPAASFETSSSVPPSGETVTSEILNVEAAPAATSPDSAGFDFGDGPTWSGTGLGESTSTSESRPDWLVNAEPDAHSEASAPAAGTPAETIEFAPIASDAPSAPSSHDAFRPPLSIVPIETVSNEPVPSAEPPATTSGTAALPEVAERAAVESLKPKTWEEAVGSGIVETPVLDPQRLEAASMGQPQLRTMLVDAFVTQTPARLERLRQAVVAGNAAEIEFESHGMKGMCATIGAMRCAEVFEHMERLAAQKRLEPLAYKLQRAESELARVDEWLKEPPAQAA